MMKRKALIEVDENCRPQYWRSNPKTFGGKDRLEIRNSKKPPLPPGRRRTQNLRHQVSRSTTTTVARLNDTSSNDENTEKLDTKPSPKRNLKRANHQNENHAFENFTVGGDLLSQSASADESEITEEEAPSNEDISVQTLPVRNDSKRRGFDLRVAMLMHGEEPQSDLLERVWWTDESNNSSSPFRFKIGDETYLHPPLPPGWELIVSDSQKRPFYYHPDRGGTWHCPVVLPRKSSIVTTRSGITDGEKKYEVPAYMYSATAKNKQSRQPNASSNSERVLERNFSSPSDMELESSMSDIVALTERFKRSQDVLSSPSDSSLSSYFSAVDYDGDVSSAVENASRETCGSPRRVASSANKSKKGTRLDAIKEEPSSNWCGSELKLDQETPEEEAKNENFFEDPADSVPPRDSEPRDSIFVLRHASAVHAPKLAKIGTASTGSLSMSESSSSQSDKSSGTKEQHKEASQTAFLATPICNSGFDSDPTPIHRNGKGHRDEIEEPELEDSNASPASFEVIQQIEKSSDGAAASLVAAAPTHLRTANETPVSKDASTEIQPFASEENDKRLSMSTERVTNSQSFSPPCQEAESPSAHSVCADALLFGKSYKKKEKPTRVLTVPVRIGDDATEKSPARDRSCGTTTIVVGQFSPIMESPSFEAGFDVPDDDDDGLTSPSKSTQDSVDVGKLHCAKPRQRGESGYSSSDSIGNESSFGTSLVSDTSRRGATKTSKQSWRAWSHWKNARCSLGSLPDLPNRHSRRKRKGVVVSQKRNLRSKRYGQ